jgi:hypothetical protein
MPAAVRVRPNFRGFLAMTLRIARILQALTIAGALLAAPAALADWSFFHRREPPHHPDEKKPHAVPEFDPAAGGALIALLAGGGLYVASRRRESK